MAMITLNGFVLIDDVVEQEDYTEAGIYTGKLDDEKAPVQGTLVAVSAEPETGVQVGDTVLFLKKAVQPVKIEGKTLYLLGEKSLIGLVVNE